MSKPRRRLPSEAELSADFKALRDHLREQHGRYYRWNPGLESFGRLWARMAEEHIEQHTETSRHFGDEHEHLAVRVGGNACPVCGGAGRVIAFGFNVEPQVFGCPECAGLAVTPASADEDDLEALREVV